MQWTRLSHPDQLLELISISHQTPCVIFKHSTRCSISSIAQHRLKIDWPWEETELRTFHVDVIESRAVSDAVARQFGVDHESPQVLVIVDGRCVHHSSHLDISISDLEEALQAITR